MPSTIGRCIGSVNVGEAPELDRVAARRALAQNGGMSKSLERVIRCLAEAGLDSPVVETPLARTAADAAASVGCELDQIVKSIVFADAGGAAVLFLTAGGNRVDPARAAVLAGGPLGKADAALVRAQTGFAIGGVAPVGHLTSPRAWFDPRLMAFETVWAVAGTPHHVFSISPARLRDLSGATPARFTV